MLADKMSSFCVWNLRITCVEQRMGILKGTEDAVDGVTIGTQKSCSAKQSLFKHSDVRKSFCYSCTLNCVQKPL